MSSCFWPQSQGLGRSPDSPSSAGWRSASPPQPSTRVKERAECGEAELAAAYDLYAPDVFGLAMRILGVRAAAEEVTQDVFLAAWSHRHDLDLDLGRGSLRPWLLTTARNRAIDLTRGPRGRQRDEEQLLQDQVAAVDVEASVLGQLDQQAIRSALANLAPAQREAIEKAYFEGRTARDIAAAAGVPPSTIKGRLRLGLNRLARDLALHAATRESVA